MTDEALSVDALIGIRMQMVMVLAVEAAHSLPVFNRTVLSLTLLIVMIQNQR